MCDSSTIRRCALSLIKPHGTRFARQSPTPRVSNAMSAKATRNTRSLRRIARTGHRSGSCPGDKSRSFIVLWNSESVRRLIRFFSAIRKRYFTDSCSSMRSLPSYRTFREMLRLFTEGTNGTVCEIDACCDRAELTAAQKSIALQWLLPERT